MTTDELGQAKIREEQAREQYEQLKAVLREAHDEYNQAKLERELLAYTFCFDPVDTPARRRRQEMLVLRREGMIFRKIGKRYGVSVTRAQRLVHQAEREPVGLGLSAGARKMACYLLDLDFWDDDTVLTTDRVLTALAAVTNEQLLEWSGCGKITIAELRCFERLHRGKDD